MEPDQLLRNEWWPKALNLSNLWSTATGNGVTIASCDTGVYENAKDLSDNLLLKYARDFANPGDRLNVYDGNFLSQGTASAGIMVGVKNFKGINGIAYNARLIPLQNFHYAQQLDKVSLLTATERCIKYAITIPQVSIIAVQTLISNSSIELHKGVRDAVELAIRSGVTIVVPAGDSTKELSKERIYDSGSIIVGALAQDGKTAIFSNYGSRITVSSYGEKIKALWGMYGETRYFGGTLAASAQIAGIIALAKERNSQLLPADIKWLLKTTRTRSTNNYNVGGLVNPTSFLREAIKYQTDIVKAEEAEKFRNQISREILKYSWAQ
jgi:subtilisin family serine protease